MKPTSQLDLVLTYLGFWLLFAALVVGGYDLALAHPFHLPVVDLLGWAGVFLITQAVYAPFLLLRLRPTTPKLGTGRR